MYLLLWNAIFLDVRFECLFLHLSCRMEFPVTSYFLFCLQLYFSFFIFLNFVCCCNGHNATKRWNFLWRLILPYTKFTLHNRCFTYFYSHSFVSFICVPFIVRFYIFFFFFAVFERETSNSANKHVLQYFFFVYFSRLSLHLSFRFE